MKSTNPGGLEEIQQPVTTEVVWEMPMPDGKEVSSEFLRRAPEGTTTIIIPDGVEKIEHRAFNIRELEHLKKVFVPGSIKNDNLCCTWEGAFKGCQELEEVILEEGLECIDPQAFQDCLKLIKVSMPKSLREIRPFAFQGCQNLETLETEESTELELEEICNWAFYDCKSLKDVSKIRADFVRHGAFSQSGIESFYMSDCSTYPSTFINCADLRKVVLTVRSKLFGGKSFLGCNKLELLVLPDDSDVFSEDEQAALEECEFIGIQPGSQVHIQASSEYLKEKFNKMLETDRFSRENGRVSSEKIPLLEFLERIHTGGYPEDVIKELPLSVSDILKLVKGIKSLKRKEVWVQWFGNFLDELRGVTQDAGNDPVSHTSDLRGAAEVSNMPTQQADEDLNKKIEVMLKRFHDESLTLCDFMLVCMAIKDSNNPGPEMTTTDSGMTETGLDIALGRLGLFDKGLKAEGGAKSGLSLGS